MLQRFTNLRVPAGGDASRPAEIDVADGRIAAVRFVDEASGDADAAAPRIDLGGALVLPGVIDVHVHFDDPGFTHREDFATGTRAAAAGGVTCVVDMPCTSLPPITNRAALDNKLGIVTPKAHVDFMLWGGVSGGAMDEPGWRENLGDLARAGVASIKVYMTSGMRTFSDLSDEQIRAVLEQTRELGVPVGVHAEDRELCGRLAAELRAQGKDAPLDYAASRPAQVEVSAIRRLRELCRETGARVHVVHLGSGEGLDVIAEGRAEGLPLSAETCPQYLAFTDVDLAEQGALLKTAPVVKAEADRRRLWRGLRDGELSFVATDHAAGEWPDEKRTGSIWTDYGGVPGVELSLPYLLDRVRAGELSLERLVQVTAAEPARFLGIAERKGALAPGFDADFAAVDADARWTVRAEGMHNKNRYTPLEGRELVGRVRSTWLRGRCVFRRDADGGEHFAGPGVGRWVRRETPA